MYEVWGQNYLQFININICSGNWGIDDVDERCED